MIVTFLNILVNKTSVFIPFFPYTFVNKLISIVAQLSLNSNGSSWLVFFFYDFVTEKWQVDFC